jgi:hypothetical protein
MEPLSTQRTTYLDGEPIEFLNSILLEFSCRPDDPRRYIEDERWDLVFNALPEQSKKGRPNDYVADVRSPISDSIWSTRFRVRLSTRTSLSRSLLSNSLASNPRSLRLIRRAAAISSPARVAPFSGRRDSRNL